MLGSEPSQSGEGKKLLAWATFPPFFIIVMKYREIERPRLKGSCHFKKKLVELFDVVIQVVASGAFALIISVTALQGPQPNLLYARTLVL
jgi:hypothetical protein